MPTQAQIKAAANVILQEEKTLSEIRDLFDALPSQRQDEITKLAFAATEGESMAEDLATRILEAAENADAS